MPGNTILLADELEVTKRLRILFTQLSKMAELDKQSWIIKTIFDEVIEEINERTIDNREEANAVLAMMFAKVAHMMMWVATGNVPEEMKDDEFAVRIFGKIAIGAGDAGTD